MQVVRTVPERIYDSVGGGVVINARVADRVIGGGSGVRGRGEQFMGRHECVGGLGDGPPMANR